MYYNYFLLSSLSEIQKIQKKENRLCDDLHLQRSTYTVVHNAGENGNT